MIKILKIKGVIPAKINLKSNRIKWNSDNALALYNMYFTPFTYNNYHTLAYISDHLEKIFVFEEYERMYFDFFIKN
jgi:hypothetical protein